MRVSEAMSVMSAPSARSDGGTGRRLMRRSMWACCRWARTTGWWVITDRDIALRAVARAMGRQPSETSHVAGREILLRDEDTAHVARNMAEQQVRRLPVVSRHKRLVGILSWLTCAARGRRPRGRQRYRGIAEPAACIARPQGPLGAAIIGSQGSERLGCHREDVLRVTGGRCFGCRSTK